MGNFPTRVDTFVRVDAASPAMFNQTMGGVGWGSVTASGVARTAPSLVKGRVHGWHVVFVTVVGLLRGSHVEWTCVSIGQVAASGLQSYDCVARVVLLFST